MKLWRQIISIKKLLRKHRIQFWQNCFSFFLKVQRFSAESPNNFCWFSGKKIELEVNFSKKNWLFLQVLLDDLNEVLTTMQKIRRQKFRNKVLIKKIKSTEKTFFKNVFSLKMFLLTPKWQFLGPCLIFCTNPQTIHLRCEWNLKLFSQNNFVKKFLQTLIAQFLQLFRKISVKSHTVFCSNSAFNLKTIFFWKKKQSSSRYSTRYA